MQTIFVHLNGILHYTVHKKFPQIYIYTRIIVQPKTLKGKADTSDIQHIKMSVMNLLGLMTFR